VIPQEGEPILGGVVRTEASQVLADCGVGHLVAQELGFRLDTFFAPGGVFQSHALDEVDDLEGDRRSSSFRRLGFPIPEQTKHLTMPADHGGGLHDGVPPKDRELVAKGQIFEDEIGAVLREGPKEGEKRRDEGHRRVPGEG